MKSVATSLYCRPTLSCSRGKNQTDCLPCLGYFGGNVFVGFDPPIDDLDVIFVTVGVGDKLMQ